MPVTLMPLPYEANALEPHISAQTLNFHHGKHHASYVEKTNAAIEGTPLDKKPLEHIIRTAEAKDDTALFNSAAQTWNHGFYWHSLSPETSEPSAALAKAIQRDFNGQDTLIEKLAATAEQHFGSGWAWLMLDGDKLVITDTHDAKTPLTSDAVPLLAIDVWEHAYYLDWQNARDAHLKVVTGHLLNWQFASENFARAEVWTYPD